MERNINIGINELTHLIVNGLDGVYPPSHKNEIVYQLLSNHIYNPDPPKSKFMEDFEHTYRSYVGMDIREWYHAFAELIDKHKADKEVT